MDQTVEELKNQLLSEVISEHREKLGMTLEELQVAGDMFMHNRNVGQLNRVTLKDREKEQKSVGQR